MNWLTTILILVFTILAVFWEAAFHPLRDLVGAQVHLLPALTVYAALSAGFPNTILVAFFGGLAFDSLSANPAGISVLPLFAIGIVIHAKRELLLRDQWFAQIVLGAITSLLAPLLTLMLLFTTGHNPLVGWGTVWQLIVMSVGGGLVTPVIFEIFGWANRTFSYARRHESSFRPDREIRRGR
jgi:rod shape-determining protein MreD